MDPVVIAGAGPVGCTIAMYLAQNDIPVMLLEAEADLPRDLRASTFHPPTLDMLDRLGLTEGMIEQGLKVHHYQYRDRRTHEVAKFEMAVLGDETNHPYRLQCEQWKMTGLAVNELNEIPHADVRFKTRIKGFDDTNGTLKVLVQDDDGEQLIDASYLIGTDGANSVVRQASGTRFKGMTYPELFLVISTPYRFEDYFEDLSLVNYVSDPEEWCVLLATLDFWRVLIPTPTDIEDENVFLSDEFIQDRLHRLAENEGDFEIIHRTLYRVHQRVAETYRPRDRVLLAGDAAHVNNPLGGMGMNGGIHDGINLAEKLVDVINHGKDRDEMLDLYDRQRRGICEQFILKHTSKNKKLMEAKEEAVQRARQEKLMKACSDEEIAKAYIMETSMINSLKESYAIT